MASSLEVGRAAAEQEHPIMKVDSRSGCTGGPFELVQASLTPPVCSCVGGRDDGVARGSEGDGSSGKGAS